MNIELEYYQTIVDDKLPMKIVKAELQNLIKAVEAERYNSSKCQMQTLVVPGNGLPEWWPENPYPESIFPMTDKEYLEAIPNPNLRTAISGFLYRAGWLVATKQISEALRNYLEDLKEA